MFLVLIMIDLLVHCSLLILSPVCWCDGCFAGTSSLHAPPVSPYSESSVSFLSCELSLLQPYSGVWLHRPEGHPQTCSSIHTGRFVVLKEDIH